MKKLAAILLLALCGYYIYQHGLTNILSGTEEASPGRTKIAAGKPLPPRAPQRACKPNISRGNFSALESAVFAMYDPKAAFALAELAYSTGLDEAQSVINKYLEAFPDPDDKARILTLITKYQDKESLNMLGKFFTRGTFPRKTLIRKIADFQAPEASEIIYTALSSDNPAVRAEAEAMYNEVKDKSWFTAGSGKRQSAGQHAVDMMNMPAQQTE